MKFHNGNELFQKHCGYLKIVQLWFGERVFDIGYYPQHTFHFWCHSNGAVKGKDNVLDLNLHILGFFFSYTDYGYHRYKKEANNYEKQLLQYAIREKAKQVYAVRKMGLNIETSCWEIDCHFFTDKEVACTYAKMNKSSLTCDIIEHELGQLANIPDDVFAQIPDDGNKELAAQYRRVMREKK